ncbi:serine/threonine protein kinase, partial [Planctomycetota bacterium]
AASLARFIIGEPLTIQPVDIVREAMRAGGKPVHEDGPEPGRPRDSYDRTVADSEGEERHHRPPTGPERSKLVARPGSAESDKQGISPTAGRAGGTIRSHVEPARVDASSEGLLHPPSDTDLSMVAGWAANAVTARQPALVEHLEVGAVLGDRFELLHWVSDVGRGTLWQATDQLGRSQCSLFALRPALLADPGEVQQFGRAAQAMTGLDHKRIWRALELTLDSRTGLPFLRLEPLSGITLGQWIASRRRTGTSIPVHVALRVAEQLLQALHHAQRTVTHGDLSPDSVLVPTGERFRVKVFGFGGVRRRPVSTGSLRTDAVVTTPYAPPEVRLAGAEIDAHGDVYSVFAILYEMLTGELPAEDPEVPSRRRHGLPEGIDAVLLKALHREPEGRFGSAKSARKEVKALRRKLSPRGKQRGH